MMHYVYAVFGVATGIGIYQFVTRKLFVRQTVTVSTLRPEPRPVEMPTISAPAVPMPTIVLPNVNDNIGVTLPTLSDETVMYEAIDPAKYPQWVKDQL